MINDRENEIISFIPEEYWSVILELEGSKGDFEAKFLVTTVKTTLQNKEDVDNLLLNIKDCPLVISKIKETERKRNPALPL